LPVELKMRSLNLVEEALENPPPKSL